MSARPHHTEDSKGEPVRGGGAQVGQLQSEKQCLQRSVAALEVENGNLQVPPPPAAPAPPTFLAGLRTSPYDCTGRLAVLEESPVRVPWLRAAHVRRRTSAERLSCAHAPGGGAVPCGRRSSRGGATVRM